MTERGTRTVSDLEYQVPVLDCIQSIINTAAPSHPFTFLTEQHLCKVTAPVG